MASAQHHTASSSSRRADDPQDNPAAITEREVEDNFIYFRRADPAPEPVAPDTGEAPAPAGGAPEPPAPDPAPDGTARRP